MLVNWTTNIVRVLYGGRWWSGWKYWMEDVWPEFNKSSSLRPNRAWAKRTIHLSALRLQILPIPAAFLLCGSLLIV